MSLPLTLPPVEQFTRQDIPRTFDLFMLMSQPLPKGSCQVPFPSSSRAFDASGLPVEQKAYFVSPGLARHSALGRAGATFLVFDKANSAGNVSLCPADFSKVGNWGNASDVSAEIPPNIQKAKRVSAVIVCSTHLFKAAPLAALIWMEAQLHAAIGSAIDLAAISGAGTEAEPLGLLNNTEVTTLEGPITLAKVASHEKSIAEAFCESSPIGVIVSPTTRETMRTSFVNGEGSASIWESLADMNRQTSPHMPANSGIVGDFSQLVVTLWGPMNILVNPYSLDSSGKIRVVIDCYADLSPLRAEAFGNIGEVEEE